MLNGPSLGRDGLQSKIHSLVFTPLSPHKVSSASCLIKGGIDSKESVTSARRFVSVPSGLEVLQLCNVGSFPMSESISMFCLYVSSDIVFFFAVS